MEASMYPHPSFTVEQLRPFMVQEKGIVLINPRVDHSGYLELQAVEGGTVFLFRGALTIKQCEAKLEQEIPDFDLAAAVGQSARMKLEKSIGQITLFSKKQSWGFVRTCDFPEHLYTTQAKLA